jgi:hypothetical protein
MCEVVNIKNKKCDVYIGRHQDPEKGFWGNPFSHSPETLAEFRVATRKEAISKYEQYLLGRPDMIARLHELKHKKLGCFCKPKSCHGDILKKYVDELEKNIVSLF